MGLRQTLAGWLFPVSPPSPSAVEESSVTLEAASQLPPVADPKVTKGQSTIPSFFTSAKPQKGTALSSTDRRLANIDISTYRGGASTQQVMRDFAAASPDLSAALFAYLRVAITDNFTAVARNMDGTFNRDATQLLQQILVRMNWVPDYTQGTGQRTSLRSVSESLAKELVLYGAMSGELVLDKARLPSYIAPVSTTTIKFETGDKEAVPYQELGGEKIPLDIPTFFYSSLDQSLLTAYAESMLQSAIQPVQMATQFFNDLRRVMNKAIHPRMDVEISIEQFKKNLPAEANHDPDKLKEYMDQVLADVESQMSGLAPEDAMVHFDMMKAQYLNGGNNTVDRQWTVLQEVIESKMSTGAKTMPSTLGYGSGSQNIASAETLLFMKNAEGAVQAKLNEFFSRALTLAVRLFGQDVYVEFKYDKIDLRPDSELEAFKSQKQSRILDQLSLGLISDDEACLTLTGSLPPAGAPQLSGTFFRSSAGADPAVAEAAYSNTGASKGAGGALNQTVQSDAPKNKRGQQNAK